MASNSAFVMWPQSDVALVQYLLLADIAQLAIQVL